MTNPNKVGLVFAALIGGMHFLWSVLVAAGVAQSMYNFILWAHMIHVPLVIGPFDITAAVTLIILTSVMGYLVGLIASKIWNRVHG